MVVMNSGEMVVDVKGGWRGVSVVIEKRGGHGEWRVWLSLREVGGGGGEQTPDPECAGVHGARN